MSYDIVGDVHGHGDTLAALLHRLGYVRRAGVYRHPTRTAIFVGDLIDRGNKNRWVVDTVRAMVEAGGARAVMGNHELNAIHYRTAGDNGEPLRTHNARSTGQHAAFLHEYRDDPAAHDAVVAWFRTLPVFLDLGELRVIHAFWNDDRIRTLKPILDASNRLTHEGIQRTGRRGDPVLRPALQALLKGPEAALPEDVSFHDHEGIHRAEARIAWWKESPISLRDAVLVPAAHRDAIPDRPFADMKLYSYSPRAKPVFFGHYWRRGMPAPLRPNMACLDYSVARGGNLVAYRWDGETELLADRFVAVPACG